MTMHDVAPQCIMPPPRFSLAAKAISVINHHIRDSKVRETTAVGFMNLVKNGRGEFPATNPPADPEALKLLTELKVIRPVSAGSKQYEFCADEETRKQLSLFIMVENGILSGVTR